MMFSEHAFTVELSDGRESHVPLETSAKLVAASPEQRARVRLTRSGLHWDEMDEDLEIAGLLRDYQ